MNNVEEIVGRVLSEIGGLKVDIAKMSEQIKHIEKITVERLGHQQAKIDELARRQDKTEANFRWFTMLIIGYVLTKILGLL